MLAIAQGPSRAEPVTLSGITFSDELGGFAILEGRGSGSLEDPFVIVEQVATDHPTVLIVRGLTEEFGNPAGTNHFSGFWLIKVVINGTDQTWNGYRMILEQELGEGSPRFDGLSFGQEYPLANRTFTADRFSDMTVLDEPLDGIDFAGGAVRPGDRVAFNLVITHNAPREQFFLVQRHEQSIAQAPGGAKPAPTRPRAVAASRAVAPDRVR